MNTANDFTTENTREQIACILNRALTGVLSPSDPLEQVAANIAEAESLINRLLADEIHGR